MNCQETGCGTSASKDFNGMNLCNNCFDQYKFQMEQMELELKSTQW